MPITMKRTVKETGPEGNDVDTEIAFKRFVFRRNWFMLSQTDGAAYEMPAIPAWNKDRALKTLGIEIVPFEMISGNCQGYCRGNQIAINPLAQAKEKTLFHEAAHSLLHSGEQMNDSENLPRSLKEAEAEGTALIVLECLGLPGAEYGRGYIQSWLQGAEIPERSCMRIFACADKIIRAGRETVEAQDQQ
jgi:hypothetical protein